MKRFFAYTLVFAAWLMPALSQEQPQNAELTVQTAESSDSIQRTEKTTKPVTLADKAKADTLYAHEDFEQAAQLYLALIEANGESAQIYYNLGNCYYRMEQMARAVLYYERALLFDPGDADIRFNLDMARAKTVDKVVPASEMFFVTAFRSMVLSMSIQSWAWLAIVAFVAMLVLFSIYLFAPHLLAKKLGFAGAVIMLLACIVANVAAQQQRSHIQNRTGAVVMAPSVVVKSTPSASGTDLFILHDGTCVEIVDESMKEWCEIRVSDGKEGWVPKKDIEVI